MKTTSAARTALPQSGDRFAHVTRSDGAEKTIRVLDGQAIWLHSINTAAHVTAIYDYLEAMLHTGAYLPPSGLLADCQFQRFDFDAAAQAKISRSNF